MLCYSMDVTCNLLSNNFDHKNIIQNIKFSKLPDKCELSSVNSGCGKSGSNFGNAVYSNRALIFGMLALFRDGFFCCNTVSIL